MRTRLNILAALAALACMIAGARFSVAADASASRPATAPAARAGGTWSVWTNMGTEGPRASTAGALWFGPRNTAQIVRFDRQTEKMTAFTALDGLPLEAGELARITTAADERCAILICNNERSHVYLWRPRGGWLAVPPPPAGGLIRDLAFDAGDNLLALCQGGVQATVLKLDDGRWRALCATPHAGNLIPLGAGFMVWLASPAGADCHAAYVPAEPGADPRPVALEGGSYNAEYYRVGDKTLCLAVSVHTAFTSRETGFEVSPTGFKPALTGKFVGFDLKAGGFLDCQVLQSDNDHLLVQPRMAHGPKIDLIFGGTCDIFHPFRDRDGALWHGGQRWDGKAWRVFEFPNAFPADPARAHEHPRLRLSDDGSAWQVLDPLLPLWATGYDAEKHTAWIRTPRMGRQGELRLVRAAGDKLEVLRTVPYDNFAGLPQFQGAEGDWWLSGQAGVMRLTATGMRQYEVWPERLVRSPRGNIWACRNQKYLRFNPARDEFVAAEPWDDFAVACGRQKLAWLPASVGVLSELYCQADGTWRPFVSPFSPNPCAVAGQCVDGPRLLTWVMGVGVLEYDAAENRWVRLAEHGRSASFDARGRRIIVGDGVYVFTGDPFAAQVAPPEDDEFARLLRQLDDDKWAVREAATRQVAALADRYHARISAALNDLTLSVEVRRRLASVLPQEETVALPPPLLRKMHPVLTRRE